MVERMFGVVSKRADTRLSGPKVSAVLRGKTQNNAAEIVNISSHGLRFKSETIYEVGDKLWFDIESTDEEYVLSLSIKGRIVNDYVNTGDEQYSYGVRFFRFRFLNEIERLHNYVYSIKKSFLPPQMQFGNLR